MTPIFGSSNLPFLALIPLGKYYKKGGIFIIPITETEYKALRKMLSIDNFIGMHCHHKKHYMVASKENIDVLKDYRNSITVYRKFEKKKKK